MQIFKWAPNCRPCCPSMMWFPGQIFECDIILAQDSSLDLANETLRRFLPDEDQRTGSEIVRAIAVFLIEE